MVEEISLKRKAHRAKHKDKINAKERANRGKQDKRNKTRNDMFDAMSEEEKKVFRDHKNAVARALTKKKREAKEAKLKEAKEEEPAI